MAGSRWTEHELGLLKELWPVYNSWHELVQDFPGRGRTSIEKQAQRLGLTRPAGATKTALLSRPQSQRKLAWDSVPRFDQFDNLTGDFAVSADWHVPLVDPEMLRLYLEVGKHHHIRRALVLGDFLNEDQFSHYVAAGLSPSDIKFGDELTFAAQALEELLITFSDGLYFLRGNHDDRILRLLKWSLGISDVFALIGRRVAERLKYHLEQKARTSENSVVHVSTSRGLWFACHPSAYSKVPNAVARDIAEVEQMHVILGNGHLLGMSKDRSGRHWCVDCGCIVDPGKVWYHNQKVKRFPKWNQGFVMLRGGFPVIFDKEAAREDVPKERN